MITIMLNRTHSEGAITAASFSLMDHTGNESIDINQNESGSSLYTSITSIQ